MGNPFVQSENYEETITDPRDGDTWTVTLRELNAGDDAAIRDETVIEIEEAPDGELLERMRVPRGSLRVLCVERALVSWTLPLALSPNAIRALNSDIFDQIYAKTRFAEAKAKQSEEGKDPPTAAPMGDQSPEPTAAGDS